jgi:hypothetical protein
MDAARPGVVVSPGSRIEVNVTLRRGAELTGVVVDEHQRPIQGARVSASATGVHGDRRSGETDAEGVFRISGLPPGMLAELFVAKRGYASAWLKQDLTTGMSNLTITLQKPIALRGRVVHVGSRAPAKDFWVKLLSSERIGPRRERPPGPRPYLPPQRFFTDPDGRFSTPVWEPGIYCIAAGTKDGKRSRPVEVRIESEREAEPAELVLEPGAAIHGLILDTSGRIVEGAQVHACAFLGNGRYSLERAASDEKGHYQFLGLGSGPHLLRAFVPGDVEWEATTAVDLAPGNRLTVNLTLERCGTLEVRVLGRTDEPVERVAVVTHRTFGAQDFELGYLAEKHSEEVDGARFFLTDASGCTLPRHLPPGTYTVVAAVMPPGPISLLFLRDNSDAVRQTVTVAPGQTTRIDIRLGRRDGPQDRSRESR